MRVVALTCSNTEIVAALGCADRLVGVDDHSDHPDAVVARLPRVGPDLGVDPRRVAALRPDLVLASLTVPGHERVVEALERAGLPLLVTRPVSIDDVYADIKTIGRALGVGARAETVVLEMQSELVPMVHGGSSPRLLVEWWPKPVIVPGRRSWVHQLLELAGATNPMAHRDIESTPITDDEARALEPDAVVIAWCGVRLEKYRPDVVYRRPAWRDLLALRNGRVYCVSEAFLGRPGPRLVEGYRALSRIAHAIQSSERLSISSI
jgi:iron complex transport system substrate-binding protein